jgi:hypothetical protein
MTVRARLRFVPCSKGCGRKAASMSGHPNIVCHECSVENRRAQKAAAALTDARYGPTAVFP